MHGMTVVLEAWFTSVQERPQGWVPPEVLVELLEENLE